MNLPVAFMHHWSSTDNSCDRFL